MIFRRLAGNLRLLGIASGSGGPRRSSLLIIWFMPRFKVLKSVAHNIGHSFTSLMNYSRDDYSMGHILRFARETGLKHFHFWCIQGNRSRGGFSPRKAALR
jgi:hypothetical protein